MDAEGEELGGELGGGENFAIQSECPSSKLTTFSVSRPVCSRVSVRATVMTAVISDHRIIVHAIANVDYRAIY